MGATERLVPIVSSRLTSCEVRILWGRGDCVCGRAWGRPAAVGGGIVERAAWLGWLLLLLLGGLDL